MTPDEILEDLDSVAKQNQSPLCIGAAELIRKLQTQVKDLESILDNYGITKDAQGKRSPEWL